MPRSIGNEEVVENQCIPVTTAVNADDVCPDYVTTGYVQATGVACEPPARLREMSLSDSDLSMSRNRVVAGLRRERAHLEERLEKVKAAIDLIDANPEALENYRIIAQGR